MKVYKCDACGEVIENPYEVNMKEFRVTCSFEVCGVLPSFDKRTVKIDLCDKCFKGLHLIAKRKGVTTNEN